MPMIGDIHYEEHGAGPPVMLVTGLSGVKTSWAAQVPRLAPQFRLITHDHRGTGESVQSLITYSVEQMARDALTLMDGLGITRADFVGHSTGGAIVQWIALNAPERISRAVLSSTWSAPDPYFVRSFEFRKDVLRKLGPDGYVRASSFSMYPPDWFTANEASVRRAEEASLARFPATDIVLSRIDAICRFDLADRLGEIKIPTLITCAEDDRVTPVYLSHAIAERILHARKVIFPWGGHASPTLNADDYAALVRMFLS
ncbi:alpha/beta hydrolase [Bradyrhizobium sp. LHD-71]|uniref:alpha/beta fold hydrolase n=1 Tax=Bradyrhizobium sp. LHD-71 TaxID=3072141 RepID=UPI00280DAAF1|nr:alpha/beta hydrolase [Bradyrhizobium sp. LHD-71]MDQ8728316.1 alpha/beta hydrolase [Bradyrhizobium sp. LHD-71]